MTWHQAAPFDSSNIADFRYEDASQTLEVTFLNGNTYQYFDVPFNVWVAFDGADSKGKFLNAIIKGSYRYSRV